MRQEKGEKFETLVSSAWWFGNPHISPKSWNVPKIFPYSCRDPALPNLTPQWWVGVREVGAPESVELSVKKRPAGNFHNLWASRFRVQKMTLNDHTEAAMCYGPRQVRRKCMKFYSGTRDSANLWSRCPFGGNKIVANPLIPLMTSCTRRLWTTVIVQI